MAAADNIWRIRLPDGGQEYELKSSDIKVSFLRQAKQWFGPAYGKYLPFVQMLMEGDGDAWCCAVWLCQKNAGEKPKPPQFMDFSVGDVMLSSLDDDDQDDDVPADVEGNPTTSEPADQSRD